MPPLRSWRPPGRRCAKPSPATASACPRATRGRPAAGHRRRPPAHRATSHRPPGPGVRGPQSGRLPGPRTLAGRAACVGPPRGAVRHPGRQRGGRAVQRKPRSRPTTRAWAIIRRADRSQRLSPSSDRDCPWDTVGDRCLWHAGGTAGEHEKGVGCRRRLQIGLRRGRLQGPGKVAICLVRTTGRVGPVSGGRQLGVWRRESDWRPTPTFRSFAETLGSGGCQHRGIGGHHRPDTRNGDTWPAETADVQEQTASAPPGQAPRPALDRRSQHRRGLRLSVRPPGTILTTSDSIRDSWSRTS
jgi:hypothetical protein